MYSYKKGNIIGEGSFGVVYQAFDEDHGQLFAVKEINFNKINKNGLETKISSFEQEIKILSMFPHKNIVKYYGTKKTDEYLHILLEYCPGGSIAKLLDQYITFPEDVIRSYTQQILEGLEYLHYHNLIHTDIKGANILVDENGNCKLSDFGGTTIIRPDKESNTNCLDFKGTPNWMAPEIIKQQEHSRYSDIWSLGCTIIEMCTGEPPWSEYKNHLAAVYQILVTETPPKLPDNISKNLRNFLERCFIMNPTERANVVELLKHPFIINSEKEESRSDYCNTLEYRNKNKSDYATESLKMNRTTRDESKKLLSKGLSVNILTPYTNNSLISHSNMNTEKFIDPIDKGVMFVEHKNDYKGFKFQEVKSLKD